MNSSGLDMLGNISRKTINVNKYNENKKNMIADKYLFVQWVAVYKTALIKL